MLKKYIVILLAVVLVAYGCSRKHYPTASKAYTMIETPSSFERGKNIAYNVCGGCHYNEAAGKFIGMPFPDMPRIAGKVYTANLTSSKMYGVLTKYSNAEIAYLLHTGIARDGRFIPFMLRPTMSDDDINDLIVFLHSRVPEVAPGDTSVGHTHYNFIGRAAINKLAKPQPADAAVKRPSADDAVSDGRYLVDIIGCYHCHSEKITKLNYTQPEKTPGYLEGGMKMKSDHGKVRASNLTPDKQTGIGNYTQADFKRALTAGKARDGRKLRMPMPVFDHLTDKQISNIYTYLMSRPAKQHAVKH